MKRALYFVYLDTHFVELSRVAEVLRAEGGYESIFMFAYRYAASGRDIEACLKSGYRCIDSAGLPLNAAAAAPQVQGNTSPAVSGDLPRPSLLRRLWRRLPERLRRHLRALPGSLRSARPRQLLLSVAFPNLPMYLDYLRSQQATADSIVNACSPDLLVLPEDNVEYMTGALIRAARARGIPSVIFPFTIANAEEIAEAYWHNADYSLARWRNRLAGWLYPRWVRAHRGRSLLPLPAGRIVATELLGMAPPLPWIINSGGADAIAVEGPFMREYYLAAGLPERQLALTGAIYDDVLYRELAAARTRGQRIYEELGLDPQKPILLCALPPDQFRSGRPGAEFGSYEQLLRAWTRALLAAREFSVVIRPHPRTLKQELSCIAGERGLTITERDTASLIPHCDLFVACVSATIRMAIAAGKPVINYDCYRFRYHDFDRIPGVITVDDEQAFGQQLIRMSDAAARDALAAKQRAFASGANWLDGRAHERILALVDALAGKK